MTEPHRDTHSATGELSGIVGAWRTEGHVLGDQPLAIVGSDIYELLPGGHFLVHHVDVVVGDRRVIAIEVIGEHEPGTGAMLARAYDNDGAVTVMQVRIDGSGAWHFVGGAEMAPAARQDAAGQAEGSVQATLRVSDDGESMHALWKRAGDGSTWVPWMDVHFTRRERPPLPPGTTSPPAHGEG